MFGDTEEMTKEEDKKICQIIENRIICVEEEDGCAECNDWWFLIRLITDRSILSTHLAELLKK